MTFLQISMALNIGSIVLGAGAWLLGILAITTSKAITSQRNTALSFSFCTLSLLSQLFEVKNRAGISDYAAIEDTISAVLIASATLIIITVVLNVVAWVKVKKRLSNLNI